jgi:transposase
MIYAQTNKELFERMLNLADPWSVSGMELDTDRLRLTIRVTAAKGARLLCPTCGKPCAKEDHREERSWRHLDTMQFETIIVCRTPRVNCPEHGILTAAVPWAGTYSRFTELFEQFAIDILLAAKSIKAAAGLLRLSWDQVHEIQKRAVERGLSRRQSEKIRYIGIDEKNFLKGHSYVSLIADLDRGRILELTPNRDEQAAKTLLKAIPDEQRSGIEAAAMDMWPAFMTATSEVLPAADIVHDKYHVSGYLGKAVDSVRKKENGRLIKEGMDTLKGTKYLWLTNPENWDSDARKAFKEMTLDELAVGRAWAIKESFRHFWGYWYQGAAEKFFRQWYFWATHSKLKPVIDMAKTLKRHLPGMLTYLKHRITNAVTEGLNSKIQSIKSNARGFGNFDHYRIAILFHCGKLNLYP